MREKHEKGNTEELMVKMEADINPTGLFAKLILRMLVEIKLRVKNFRDSLAMCKNYTSYNILHYKSVTTVNIYLIHPVGIQNQVRNKSKLLSVDCILCF